MIHPIPPGTRDVLPDEMCELRALTETLRARFQAAGYGEISTPTMEYEEVLRRGDERVAGAGYRLFDEHGQVLVLRSDMTIPIARVVASRYEHVEPPYRLCYFGNSYREVSRGSGQAREFLQTGIELMWMPEPHGDAEVAALVIEALSDAGLKRHRLGLGDGSLYRTLLAELEVDEEERMPLLEALSRRDLVEVGMRVDRMGLASSASDLLTTLPTLRGGPEVRDLGRHEPVSPAVENLRACHELLAERGVADRVIFDLGLVRELGYYTGAVFEVYDPAVGFALGGGGRYDELLGRFGRGLPACGMTLDVQRVHVALAAEERAGA
jgi:ATP phosphoribosyltransferase regulatory subunit